MSGSLRDRVVRLDLPAGWRDDPALRDGLDWDLAPADTGRDASTPVVWGVDVTASRNWHPYPLGNNEAQAYVTNRKREIMTRLGADLLIVRGHDLRRRDLWLSAPGVGENRRNTQQPHFDCAPYRSEHYAHQVLHCMHDDDPGAEETAYVSVQACLAEYAALVQDMLQATRGTDLADEADRLPSLLERARQEPGPQLVTTALVYETIMPLLDTLIERGRAVGRFGPVGDIHDLWTRMYENMGDAVVYVDWVADQTVICRQEPDGYMHGRFARSIARAERGTGRLLIQIS